MTKIVSYTLTLLLFSTSALAINCKKMPYNKWQPVVGQISPKKVRKFLTSQDHSSATIDYSSAPILESLNADSKKTLTQALTFGDNFRRFGNESMIYNVDAYLYIVQSAPANCTLLDLYKGIEALKATLQEEDLALYYSLFQLQGSLRVAASLRLMGRDKEAQKLENFLAAKLTEIDKNGALADGGQLQSLRMLMTNTGRFASKKNSVELCNEIKHL